LSHDVYHLGSGGASPLRRFVEAVQERCSGADITMEGGLDFFENADPRYCRMDISRARSDLGYDPEFTPEAAVADYLTRVSN
jgi:nucleoside-diphosphate-sugar epimerase